MLLQRLACFAGTDQALTGTRSTELLMLALNSSRPLVTFCLCMGQPLGSQEWALLEGPLVT